MKTDEFRELAERYVVTKQQHQRVLRQVDLLQKGLDTDWCAILDLTARLAEALGDKQASRAIVVSDRWIVTVVRAGDGVVDIYVSGLETDLGNEAK